MQRDRFARGLALAALAAALWIPATLVAAPLFGARQSAALSLAAITLCYTVAIAPSRVRRLRVALLVAPAVALVALLAQRGGELALGLAAVLALARSAFLYPRPAARALLIEIALSGGGLLFARFLGAPGLLSTALALWGFLLVQSLFFLIGDARAAVRATPRADPFDDAYRRATALLES